MTMHFQNLTTRQQYMEAFPILSQLRTDLEENTFLELLQEMQKDGYLLYGLYANKELVSVAGLAWRINFYSKKHIFIYDLVTDQQHRSKGYGDRLLEYIHKLARENGAQYVALESGIQRLDAHRFYEEKLGYDKWCYSFRKKL